MTVEVLVKAAAGSPDTLGDCEYSAVPLPFRALIFDSARRPNCFRGPCPGPFAQRVLLTLEAKEVPYETKLVDLSNKPDWFVQFQSSTPPHTLNVPHTLDH
jgi:hypothetical protein